MKQLARQPGGSPKAQTEWVLNVGGGYVLAPAQENGRLLGRFHHGLADGGGGNLSPLF
jgi:hypothetical protein